MKLVPEPIERETIADAIAAYIDAHASGDGYEGCFVRLVETERHGDQIEVSFVADIGHALIMAGGQATGRARLEEVSCGAEPRIKLLAIAIVY